FANCVARWDGTSWSALGQGMNSTVRALAVFDDGSGPALYAAGSFTQTGSVPAIRVARWNGTSWSALGNGLGSNQINPTEVVSALAVFDDGSGPALYAGGRFNISGNSSVKNIARWTGATWAPLFLGPDAAVHALCVFDDG